MVKIFNIYDSPGSLICSGKVSRHSGKLHRQYEFILSWKTTKKHTLTF